MAQELEPRRWTHLPVGANFAGIGYAYADGNIFLDPSLLIEGAQAQLHSVGLAYITQHLPQRPITKSRKSHALTARGRNASTT